MKGYEELAIQLKKVSELNFIIRKSTYTKLSVMQLGVLF